MAQKKKIDGENNKKDEGGNNEKEQKQTLTPTTVVLKVDMHCDGCASKIVRCLRGFEGVESLNAESDTGKITITGKVDPTKLRDKLAHKMKKKVDLISPLPNKNKENNSQNNNKKHKETPVTTVVLKVALHCQGCIERIRKTVLKTRGVHDMAIDKEKETVTVKGTMDVKALVGNLMERLRRKVEVVPPKKEKESEKEGGGANDGAKEKKKGGGGGGGGGDNDKGGKGGGDGLGKMEQSRMEFLAPTFGYGYGYGYGYGDGYNYEPVYMGQLHAPQMFSDENPNACSVM
ncbi:heavy metal-associated isoprenylated plant protein 3-like isoform X2 [Gastrolobium bilobum]|uniref:heavy metal-associated isoprenylated plant protein 3-like isoform X2 n=1 Tax=Gastrolobium bilobum TaxID=150636 RepID=UPI002AB246DC|nr:heavy metal-associated isoprenylated plant protein 3-like isoform X2 [Gastrolobium bilobum]